MKKISSLTSPDDFEKVFRLGSTRANKYVVLRFLRSDQEEEPWVAFVAGKKYGKAVERNRAKRLLREAYRHNIEQVAHGYDIVVIARPHLKNKSCQEAEKGLVDALNAGGLIKRKR
jgi:ribonuclease P protein component